MQKTFQWVKRHRGTLAVAAVLALAAFLHLRNLYGVIYLDEDEARAFSLLSSGPLMHIICAPIYALTNNSISAIFYFAGLLGLAGIVLFYCTSRLWLARSVAVWATFFYAVYPLRINYSRTLYPTVFLEFYFMAIVLAVSLALVSRRLWYFFLAGLLSACGFFTHCSIYTMLSGLFVAVAVVWYLWPLSAGQPRLNPLKALSRFLLGFVIGYVVLEQMLFFVGKGYCYTLSLLSFGSSAAEYCQFVPKTAVFLRGLLARLTQSVGSFSYSSATFVACACALWQGIRKRDRGLLFFSVMGIVGAAVIITASLLKLHPIEERHFVWMSSFFAVALAYCYSWFLARSSGWKRIVIRVAVVALAGLLVASSYQITVETFKITGMLRWLDQHKIRNNRMLSSWWLLNYEGDRGSVILIPGFFATAGKIKSQEIWYLDSPRFMIAWELVRKGYQAGICDYLMTSGIGERFYLGNDEPLLKNVKPIMSWLHPYCAFSHRPFYTGGRVYINLYRLSDVFSEENYFSLRNK